jgi:hypothetical protein
MVSDLVAEKRATLFVITGREALRWAEIDDSWAEQPELGGLPIAEAERLLVEEGISDPLLRETMWTNASAPDGPEDREPVYPLLLDLQVQHWRNRQTIGREVESSALRVDARDFEGHRTETGWNTEDMFPGAGRQSSANSRSGVSGDPWMASSILRARFLQRCEFVHDALLKNSSFMPNIEHIYAK